ncbi:pentatricopeptide repeat-containing protein At2g13600-like [Dioscorea cayenensis subsp. rotundata]|uniref:Pentatricopeptide repeat-containing protein At2g13600-like n=1 Tax=Dioscorea cayennensis subsp. rotundata TaxID=55577 RepID=A0AB40AU67_DIOCR|nr:pentatricopeptide repeat-containing protein At2g13600-like [Dioscorea cayenensis subsp. rotundata]
MGSRHGSTLKLANLFSNASKREPSPLLAVSLTKRITELGRHGQVDRAHHLFVQMPQRTQVSWNAMLSILIDSGRLASALELFDEMPKKNSTSYTSMITGLSRAGFVSRAWQLFDTIPLSVQNVFSWTSMITCYAYNSEPLQALIFFARCYAEFFELKILPNSHTFSVLLKSCVSIQSLHAAMQVQTLSVKVLEEDSESSTFVQNSLIDVHAKLGNLVDAEKVFDRMKFKDLGSWNTIMDAYTHHLLVNKALSVFNSMTSKDTLSWNIIMAGLSNNHRAEEALKLFICLLRSEDDSMPNASTYTIILTATTTMTMLEFGKQVHASTVKIGLYNSNVFVCNSLLSMYSNCGIVELTERVFKEMHHKDIVSWNSVIQGLGQNGCSKRALEIAEQALSANKFNHNTFTAILTSCSHGGLVDEGLKYFNSMSEIYGIEQGLDQYVCMVDMLGRAGKVEIALEMLCKMPFRANSVAWETLLSACVIHGNVNVGRIAAKELEILKPGNARSYYALASVYQKAGKAEESKRVLDLIWNKELRKNSGFSWVVEA